MGNEQVQKENKVVYVDCYFIKYTHVFYFQFFID